MEIDVNNGAFQIVMESADFNINIGESAKIDTGLAIDYIKSGEVEIEAAVQQGTNGFNANAIAKTNAFNSNSTDKITAFNDNAAIKQAAVDASATLAKQYAIGDPSEPTGNSAKYWAGKAAEQAAEELANKQDKLTAGEFISIDANNNITTTYTAGTGIAISSSGVISNTLNSSEWGNITGTLSNQTDLQNALNAKYDASNPNGYTSNTGTVTSVNNTSPDGNGNVSLSIPAVDQTYSSSSTNAQSGVAVASAINDKADVDLSNMNASQTAKNTIVSWGMPDYASGVSIALTLSYQSYTCPSDGVVVIGGSISNDANNTTLKINGVKIGYGWNAGSGQYNTCVNAEFLAGKGYVCEFKTQVVGGSFTFYPMKGVN